MRTGANARKLAPPSPETLGLDALPVPKESDSLRALLELGEHLDPWAGPSPRVFATGLTEAVSRTTLEIQIEEEWLGSVSDGCERPRDYLRHEEEVERIDRVRRIASGAAAHLGAHPEHWERRRLGTVEPRAILARRLDEELDIYENRVLAASVLETKVWVRRRIGQVNRARDRAERIDRLLKSALAHDRHWVVKRIANLAGHDVNWEGLQATANETLDGLHRLDRRLGRLLDSSLFRGLPRHLPRLGRLHETNVLANDVRYRRAVLMLKAVRKNSNRPHDESPEQWRARVEGAFQSFGNAVVRRSLEGLGFKAETPQRWVGRWGALEAQQFPDNVDIPEGVRLLDETGRILDLFLVPAEPNEDYCEAVKDRLQGRSRTALGAAHVVLFLDPSEDTAAPFFDDVQGVGSIGPQDLTSVERVGHFLWRWLAQGLVSSESTTFRHDCPMCGKSIDLKDPTQHGIGESGYWWSRCPSCKSTRWEARRCRTPGCRRLYPVLAVPEDEWTESLEASRDWWARPERGRYVCCYCGG